MRIGIIGGGPAGLSAALWLKNLGFQPWIAELREQTGGMQSFNFLANDWVLGQTGQTGTELAARFSSHVAEAGVRVLCGVRPTFVEGTAGSFQVGLVAADGSRRAEDCAGLLIATGTRYRAAEVLRDVPGFASVPAQRVICGPYAFADLDACAGRRVLIVGGGDNAFENARLLLGVGAKIHMVLRSPPRAQAIQREAVRLAQSDGNCHIHQPARIVSLGMCEGGIAVGFDATAGTAEVDRIHVLAGYEPNTDFLRQLFAGSSAQLRFDRDHYLLADALGRTDMPGIYAAGDVCNPQFPSVVSAMALGARAAKTIEMDLSTK